MKSAHPLPPPKAIAVDVDGTLFVNGVLNTGLAEWCKERANEGFLMILWSSRGLEHAKKAAETACLSDIFTTITSKPGYIVDDKGWEWIKYTRIIRNDVDI